MSSNAGRQLSALLGPETIASIGAHAGAAVIRRIELDSRKVSAGDLFAAMPGTRVDGARFIPDAVAKGAAAILCAADAVVPDTTVPVLRATDPRLALAKIAGRFYARQPQTCVAVTGTSGKSSVAEFTRQIFAGLGRQSASIGTIGVVRPDGSVYGGLTTPDPVTLHATLAGLAAEGVSHLAFEASSHGLDQRRLDGVRLTAAAFTNLGRDHMDYHATVDDYFAAKLRLFTELLPEEGTAVVNIEDPYGARVAEVMRAAGRKLITVGSPGADLVLQLTRTEGFVQHVDVGFQGRSWSFDFPMPGRYQVENVLLAAGLAIAAGEEPSMVFPRLHEIRGVPGRLEMVGEVNGGLVVVDYAHKPDALAVVLDALRPFASGKLVCVFGCGGDRDRGKRPIMGEVAARGADVVIVTDDNPRTEVPAAIRAEILASTPGAIEVGDRAEAIHRAIEMLGPGDVVVIAGKGHESGQIVGDKILPFSDQEVARAHMDEVIRRA